MAEERPGPHRDWWVTLGMGISATSAAVSSFAGLRGLAIVAGWPVWLAWLLPLTIDAYAMTATRVWLAESTRSAKARRFARVNAIGAILLSLCGNAIYHLVVVRLVMAGWVVVVGVGAVPALVLGLVSHLAVLRTQVGPFVPESVPQSVPAPPRQVEDGPKPAPVRAPTSVRHTSRPPVRTESELLAEARVAEAAHRAAHGRGISRDTLRRELHIGGTKATALVRELKAIAQSGQKSPV